MFFILLWIKHKSPKTTLGSPILENWVWGDRRAGSIGGGLAPPPFSVYNTQPVSQPAEDKAYKSYAYRSPCRTVAQKRGDGYIYIISSLLNHVGILNVSSLHY